MVKNFNMIITINNEEGETLFDVNKITDDAVKQEATVIVQKVGNLQIIIEALDFSLLVTTPILWKMNLK